MKRSSLFFVSHWYLSTVTQTFFLHRYASHKQFELTSFIEKLFHIVTFVFQKASSLCVYAYVVMQRMYPPYSDTEKDPHSPSFFKNVFVKMWHTKELYNSILTGTVSPGEAF